MTNMFHKHLLMNHQEVADHSDISSSALSTQFLSVFLRVGKPGLFFVYFCLFAQKINLVVCKFPTRIVRVESEDPNH